MAFIDKVYDFMGNPIVAGLLALFFVVFGILLFRKLNRDLEHDLEVQQKRAAYIMALEARIEKLEKEVF